MNSAKPTLPAQILSQTPSSSSITDRLWRHSLYNVLNQRPLDRVNVLGDNSHGHLSYAACRLRSHSRLTSMELQVRQCPELDARRANAPERRGRQNVRSFDSRVRIQPAYTVAQVLGYGVWIRIATWITLLSVNPSYRQDIGPIYSMLTCFRIPRECKPPFCQLFDCSFLNSGPIEA